MSNQTQSALSGIKVIDMTSVVFGPLATQILGDLGAKIMKVESRERDMLRQVLPAQNPGMGAAFLGTNCNKRSVVLDLKTPKGRGSSKRLAGPKCWITHGLPVWTNAAKISVESTIGSRRSRANVQQLNGSRWWIKPIFPSCRCAC